MLFFVVADDIFLIMLDKSSVYKHISTRGGIIAAKVPVAKMVGTSVVQSLEALEYQFYLGL